MKENPQSKLYPASTLVSIIGPVVFWIILIIIGFLNPQVNSVKQSISYLVVGPFGWLQSLNFMIFGLFILTTGAALYLTFSRSKGIKIAALIFVLMSVGEVVSGFFPPDNPPINHLSLHALMHQSGASITAVGYPASIYFLAPIFRTDSRWKDLVNYSLILGASMFALEIGREVLLPTQWLNSWFGLYERILILIPLVWTEVISMRLFHLYHSTKAGGSG